MKVREIVNRLTEVYPDAYSYKLEEEWVIFENSNRNILSSGKSLRDAWQKLFNITFPDEATDTTESYF